MSNFKKYLEAAQNFGNNSGNTYAPGTYIFDTDNEAEEDHKKIIERINKAFQTFAYFYKFEVDDPIQGSVLAIYTGSNIPLSSDTLIKNNGIRISEVDFLSDSSEYYGSREPMPVKINKNTPIKTPLTNKAVLNFVKNELIAFWGLNAGATINLNELEEEDKRLFVKFYKNVMKITQDPKILDEYIDFVSENGGGISDLIPEEKDPQKRQKLRLFSRLENASPFQ